MAKKQCDRTDWEDSDSLEALAAAYAEAEDFEPAIVYQKKALKVEEAPISRKRLKLYEQGKPFHKPARK